MEKVMKRYEMKITTKNRIGVLAEVSMLIAEKGVNIDTICAYSMDNTAILKVLTDDNETAKRTLSERGYQVDEREVILMVLWNRPGVLSRVMSSFKEHRIDLRHIYGTSSPHGAATTVVFLPEDMGKASDLLDSLVLNAIENEQGCFQ
jgi:hypothetical protein